MISYSINQDGDYVVTETTMSFTKDKVTTVTYKKDLSMKKVNNDPWVQCCRGSKDWFNKYYRWQFLKMQKTS